MDSNLKTPKKDLITTLDLNDFFAGGAKKAEFLRQLKQALQYPGFFFLKNPGINPDTFNAMKEATQKFFALPLEKKLVLEDVIGKHQRGYTPMDQETAVGQVRADNKEFLQIGKGTDVATADVPGFSEVSDRILVEFHETYLVLLRAIALAFDLDEDTFISREGNSIMRAIHYPAQEKATSYEDLVTAGGNIAGMCAAPHTDINFLTLLFTQQKGLELKHDGDWVAVTDDDPDLNIVIVNAGDTLQHITNGVCVSGEHQVKCQDGIERFSWPYFGHLALNAEIVPLSEFGEPKPEFFHTTAGEYLDARLAEIKL